jgi:diguanylate cyclase
MADTHGRSRLSDNALYWLSALNDTTGNCQFGYGGSEKMTAGKKSNPDRSECDHSHSDAGVAGLKDLSATPGRTFDGTLPYALTAMQQIGALRVPADPPSFHLWYAYASQEFQAVNQAINEMLERNGAISAPDLDRIYDQYLSSSSIAGRLQTLGADISGEVDQVIAMIDAAIGSGTDYAESLSGASRRLGDAKDQESLREIIGMLVGSTRDFEKRNEALQESLKSSREEISALQTKLIKMSQEGLIDSLTLLANRKQFDQALERAISDSEKSDRWPRSLLMCDVDHFKMFNDAFGHVVGDQVLRLIASVMKSAVRGQDTPARYGGEEFAVILPDTALRHALTVAENLRRAVSEKKIVKRSTGESLGKIAVSIGVAQFKRGEIAQTLVERADTSLYAAKHAGRDRVASELD